MVGEGSLIQGRSLSVVPIMLVYACVAGWEISIMLLVTQAANRQSGPELGPSLQTQDG